MKRSIIAVFKDAAEADRAVHRLREESVEEDHIHVFHGMEHPGEHGSHRFEARDEREPIGPRTGAIVGSLTGCIVGVSVLQFPEIENLITTGASTMVLTVVVGLLMGSIAAPLLDRLLGTSSSAKDTSPFRAELRLGRTVVVVDTGAMYVEKILRVLGESRALSIDGRINEWRMGGVPPKLNPLPVNSSLVPRDPSHPPSKLEVTPIESLDSEPATNAVIHHSPEEHDQHIPHP